MEHWRRGQLESVKLMSKSQAALLRQHAADRIHQRDALIEAALALVINNAGNAGDDSAGCDVEAAKELLEWKKRLNAETKDFDPTDTVVNERVGEELKHLRKECRSLARKLEDAKILQDERDYEEEELRHKLRKAETQASRLMELLRDVRKELAVKEEHGAGSKENFERLSQKYERAKAKIRVLTADLRSFHILDQKGAVTPGDVPPPLPSPPPRQKPPEDDGRNVNGDVCSSSGEDPPEKGPMLPSKEVEEKPQDEDKSDSTSGGASGVRNSRNSDGSGENSSAAVGGARGSIVTASSCENRAEENEVVVALEAQTGRLRLELAETSRRFEKAKKGKKAAEKEKDGLALAMAKELEALEQSKDGQIEAANREVERLAALNVRNRRALRNLVERVASEKVALRNLAIEVKSNLRALPGVAASAASAVQARLSGVEDRVEEVRRQYNREYRERRRLFNLVQELRGNIRVFCRCRPVTSHERGGQICVSFPGEEGIEIVNERGKRKAWAFDQVFDLDATQETVYAEVSPLIVSVMDGYNACIFAYGQTGTGKTYTMMGPRSNRGVNARALEELFSRSRERSGEVDDTITLSILEIYNEQIRDLLSDNAGGNNRKLEVRQGERGNIVPGLITVAVSTFEEVLRMLAVADSNRASACTNLNDHSSRSHLILSVTVNGVNRHTKGTSSGRLHLIDLAGSERISKSGAAGQALREAQNINRSLSALGDVISARASRQGHVPYRNSTLTYLLQDSLSADSKTLMLVCVSPATTNAEETSCSLNFAARVRTVELGKAQRHVDNGVTPRGSPSTSFGGSGGGGTSSASPGGPKRLDGGVHTWSPSASRARKRS